MKKTVAAIAALALFLSVTGVSFATVITDGVTSKAKVAAGETKEEDGKKKKKAIEGC